VGGAMGKAQCFFCITALALLCFAFDLACSVQAFSVRQRVLGLGRTRHDNTWHERGNDGVFIYWVWLVWTGKHTFISDTNGWVGKMDA